MGITRIEAFTLTVAKNTAKATPTRVSLPMNDATVRQIQVVIPAGHIGQTGVRIDYGNQQVIPFTGGAWITSDGEVLTWPDLTNYPTGGKWQAVGYNLDKSTAHAFYFRFYLDDLATEPAAPGLVVPVSL